MILKKKKRAGGYFFEFILRNCLNSEFWVLLLLIRSIKIVLGLGILL